MARYRKPFFRESRGLWYVWHGGKQVNLGPDEEQAHTTWHDLKAKSPELELTSDHVVLVIDAFLDFVSLHRRADTYRWYKDRLQLFTKTIPADLTLAQLKPLHVQRWIDAYPDLTSGSKRNYCRSIVRCMNWAEEQGYVTRSPLAHFKKPRGGKREEVVSDADYQKLLSLTKDQEFRDLLTATWETGARPQETLRLEARHVDLPGERWMFPASESKGGKPRIIYLSAKALEISERLVELYPEGALFRNTDGAPWTPDATNCRFRTLQKKVGKKLCLYHLRHTWMNRLLLSGVDSLTVSILAGHADPTTLVKHYQHLTQNPEFLKAQARRV